mmetsp:Transcript_7673/g.19055  ORF Transcript_7673/g.19055 Transcript_7673/m.19055 type:complete len:246 (-) Transcript_7673:228-965(-)
MGDSGPWRDAAAMRTSRGSSEDVDSAREAMLSAERWPTILGGAAAGVGISVGTTLFVGDTLEAASPVPGRPVPPLLMRWASVATVATAAATLELLLAVLTEDADMDDRLRRRARSSMRTEDNGAVDEAACRAWAELRTRFTFAASPKNGLTPQPLPLPWAALLPWGVLSFNLVGKYCGGPSWKVSFIIVLLCVAFKLMGTEAEDRRLMLNWEPRDGDRLILWWDSWECWEEHLDNVLPRPDATDD